MKKQQALLERLDAIEKQIKAIIESFDRVPDSIDDVKGRRWWITNVGKVSSSGKFKSYPSDFSTKERAEAMLALGQLIEIYRAIEQGTHRPNFLVIMQSLESVHQFWFESKDLLNEFETKHKDLIETVKRGL